MRRQASAVTFRAAAPEDAGTLTAIALAAKRHWGYPEEWIELWRRELTITVAGIERDYFSIAETAGAMAGFVSVSMDGPTAELEHLWVLPEFMGCGVGRLLFQQALSWSSSRALASLKVVADPHALGFYLAQGGTVVGRKASVPPPREIPVLRFALRPH